MASYPYEYFCGANVVLELEGQPMHEAAGISYSIQESKSPLYGYSSRHFDAMARGQVLVQGSLIVNYIHQDYLLRSIETGREFRNEFAALEGANPSSVNAASASAELSDFLENDSNVQAVTDNILTDPSESPELVSALQRKYWAQTAPPPGLAPLPEVISSSVNPHDLNRSIDLRITFGSRTPFNGFSGTTGILLSGVYFVGRGVPIQIDEEVIVEEYSFIARNAHSIESGRMQISGDFISEGDTPGEIDFEISTKSKDVMFNQPGSADRLGPISLKDLGFSI